MRFQVRKECCWPYLTTELPKTCLDHMLACRLWAVRICSSALGFGLETCWLFAGIVALALELVHQLQSDFHLVVVEARHPDGASC